METNLFFERNIQYLQNVIQNCSILIGGYQDK